MPARSTPAVGKSSIAYWSPSAFSFENNSTVSGGIANSGTINLVGGAVAFGILVQKNSTISGGIANSGTINASSKSPPELSLDNSTVSGGIVNGGTINAANRGVDVSAIIGGIAGGISNTGTINAVARGCPL